MILRERCASEGCNGVQLAASRMCLAHADGGEQEAALGAIHESGVVDVRGVPVSSALLERVRAAAPRGDKGRAVFKASRFDGVIFTGDASFAGVIFTGDASFRVATFTGAAEFGEATFTGDVDFGGATFNSGAGFWQVTFPRDASFATATFNRGADFGGATFSGAARFGGMTFTGIVSFRMATFYSFAGFSGTFRDAAWFSGVIFSHGASFDGTTFTGDASFDRATFSRAASFDRVTFTCDASFDGATFNGGASFGGVTFTGDARFGRVPFRGRAEFSSTRFEQTRQLGPLLAYRGLVLDDAQFAQRVQIEVSTTGLCCRRARFPAGVQFRLRWARVVLDDTDFPSPSLVTGIPRLASEGLAAREERIARAWQRLLGGEVSEQPQLVSLRRANVAGLGLSNVTAAGCRFEGAHNLDMLRLEANITFAAAPSPLGRLSWEGRQVIAEERALRASRRRRRGWGAPSWPDWLGEPPGALDAGQIAGLYRALRKGREDIKDEPGAADFYYGEMEMRRRARPSRRGNPATTARSSSRGRAERGVLTAYWLVSGYGLRAWRALTWLAVVIALLAIGFHLIGFARPPRPVSYWTSLLYSFRATLSLTDSDVKLTAWGKLLQGLLRLTGPVLLGLALLALRGRVKR